ncbi:testicular haploid expressed gene protein-like [Kryptolebias marmoratus]|uniref:testicular haploid expressed gene protein-like n=1 Tax=Kryptolebias marmoratus TaxID=37003 RepID=UPI0018ACFABA|nr:testicular haploid expressed gene protein-like [Kryptolebias marmoratus]
MSGNPGLRLRFGPSERILELALHRTSKTEWATTPCEQLSWGNQDPIRPISCSALRTRPSPRIQVLSRPKGHVSVGDAVRRKEEEEEEEASFFRKTRLPSSFRYENIQRLSTPRTRGRSLQEAGCRRRQNEPRERLGSRRWRRRSSFTGTTVLPETWSGDGKP